MTTRVILINGASCSGKTTICKEICKQSSDKFVHLQIDEFKHFLFTIIGHDSVEHSQGQKICNRMLVTSAKAFLDNGFNVVIDTIFYGENATEIAKVHLEQLKDCKTLFVGIDCLLEERLSRFREYNDNPVRNEKTIISQSNVFELCREMYDVEFDSMKMNGYEIAREALKRLNSSGT